MTGTQSGASLPVLLVDGSTQLFPSALSTSEPHGCCQLPGERQVWDSDCRQPCLHWWETSGQRANSFILTLPRQPAAGGTQSIQSIYNRLILKRTDTFGWRKGLWQKEVRALALKQAGATQKPETAFPKSLTSFKLHFGPNLKRQSSSVET